MSLYFFETITPAEALAYNAARDTLFFSDAAPTGANTYVTFDPTGSSITMQSLVLGKSVTFGPGLAGEQVFLSGTSLQIGATAGDVLTGSEGPDGLFGGPGADTLSGGQGGDLIDGGAGPDVLSGGTGADHFLIEAGQSAPGAMDRIADWETGDALSFGQQVANSGNYVEATAASPAEALAFANAQIAGGSTEFVAVAVGSDVIVFADSRGDHGAADDAVTLTLTTLAQIDSHNIIGFFDAPPALQSPPADPLLAEPVLALPTGTPGQAGADGTITGNMDTAHIGALIGDQIAAADSNVLVLGGPAGGLTLSGSGFTYDANEQFLGTGFISRISYGNINAGGTLHAQLILPPNFSAAPFNGWVLTDNTQAAFSTILGGNDSIRGDLSADLLRGYAGNDGLFGGGGNDTIFGGQGDDVIYANSGQLNGPNSGSTYLRGEEGNDYIIGGAGFDDANGNMGNDTISTNNGDDYAVGGKDNDLLFGDDGNDIVWGNLGNDTCDGGNGDDQVRGGQGDDLVYGGAGDDYISGDRGNDTEIGGAGADNFHSFSGAGIDRVLDFNLREGDRVQLDPGTAYTVRQVGADTVVDMGNGDQVILVGVQMSSLTGNWIFEG